MAPPDISLEQISALWPFIGLQLVGLALVLFFPQIALSLRRFNDQSSSASSSRDRIPQPPAGFDQGV